VLVLGPNRKDVVVLPIPKYSLLRRVDGPAIITKHTLLSVRKCPHCSCHTHNTPRNTNAPKHPRESKRSGNDCPWAVDISARWEYDCDRFPPVSFQDNCAVKKGGSAEAAPVRLQVRVVLIVGKVTEHKPEHRVSIENAAEDVGGGIKVV
jgi:hypothetical protein